MSKSISDKWSDGKQTLDSIGNNQDIPEVIDGGVKCGALTLGVSRIWFKDWLSEIEFIGIGSNGINHR